MAEFLVDSYSETNGDNSGLFPYNATSLGQSFTVSKRGKLASCKFYLSKAGNPTGTLNAKLYAHSGTYGTSSITTGSSLATSDNINASSIGTAALVTFTFTGVQQYLMGVGYYCIICNGSSVSGDVDNGIHCYWDATGGHGGNLVSGLTNPNATYDTCFYVYATPLSASFLLNLI